MVRRTKIPHMMPEHITIIVVTHNSEKSIDSCLRALPPGQKILVLDNGSHDQTIERASVYPQVTVIRNANIGYGRAANIGFSHVTTPYALLLNPDVKMEDGALAAMVDCAEKFPAIGIVGGQMFHETDGRKIYENAYDFNADGLCYTDWMVGAMMLFRMDALRRVGFFDEHIFLFFEETDLARRFLRAGVKIAVCAQAQAEHAAGNSSPKSLRVARIRAWHYAWSRCYFHKKHYGLATALRKACPKLFKNLKNLLCMRKTMLHINACEIMGLLSFFTGIGAYRKNGAGRLT